MPHDEFNIPITREIEAEFARSAVPHAQLLQEAMKYLDSPDVEDLGLARMYIERGYSEDLAYWLVREAEVKRAPGPG